MAAAQRLHLIEAPRAVGRTNMKKGVGFGSKDPRPTPLLQVKCRRCPTLPHPTECSTIGAEGLSFRVRNGTGRFPNAKTTDNTIHKSTTALTLPEHTTMMVVVCSGSHSGCAQQKCCGEALGLLVPVNYTHYCASISGLSTQWSTGGLNPAWGWETSSWNELPA
jgi:hypothetical protein